MVGHNPDHDKDEITQAMVRAIQGKTEDDPLIQHLIANYTELCLRVSLDPDSDPEDEIGRYEYIFSRWKPN
jgi:hypothetical protein